MCLSRCSLCAHLPRCAVGRVPQPAAALPHCQGGPPLPQVWVRALWLGALACCPLRQDPRSTIGSHAGPAVQLSSCPCLPFCPCLVSRCRWGNRKSLVEDPAAAGLDVRAELLRYYK